MGLASCFSPSIACSGKQFLTLLPYWVDLRLGLAIFTHALTIFSYVLQFLSLEIIREEISKAEGNDAMFNWEIYWLVKRIDNSTDSQIRLRCQNESEVSASGFLKKPFFSCVNHCNLLNFAAPMTTQILPLPSALSNSHWDHRYRSPRGFLLWLQMCLPTRRLHPLWR